MAMVVVAFRQIQDGGGRVLRQEFKMAHVDASTEFKMAVASHALMLLEDDGHACFGIRFKMACAFAKVECGNSIIYIYYIPCTFFVISAAPPCSMTLSRLTLVLV